jgi:hypothetical protein
MQTNQHDHWPAAVGEHAQALGLIRPGEGFVVGGPRIGEQELTGLSHDVADVLALVASLPQRLCGGDLLRFGVQYGFTPEEVGIMLWSGAFGGAHSFARADLARTEAGFRLLELNVGSSVAGMSEASAPTLLGLQPDPSPLSQWAEIVAAYAKRWGRGAIVEDASIFKAERSPLEVQAQALEQAGCPAVDVLAHDQLHFARGRLEGPNGPIGWIYPAYSARDVAADRLGYRPLQQAIQIGAAAMPVDLSDKLLGSKALLAALWTLLEEGRLDPASSALVRRIVPRTHRLDSGGTAEAISRREALVLKPAVGHGGFDVRVGCETPVPEWAALVGQAAADASRQYVLQEYQEPMLEQAVVAAPPALLRYPAHFIWGVYVGNGKPFHRPLMRCRALGGSMVINYAAGAAIGALGPQDTMRRQEALA